MESLLTRLVTYRLMNGSSLMTDFFNQPIEKFLFSLLLLVTIIGSSLYILRRTFFQRHFTTYKGRKHKNVDPQTLIDLWISQNRHFYVNIMSLCVAFVNAYTDRVKVNIFF